jgi:hypothetical protein
MKCAKCQEEIDATVRFCPHCGVVRKPSEVQPRPPQAAQANGMDAADPGMLIVEVPPESHQVTAPRPVAPAPPAAEMQAQQYAQPVQVAAGQPMQPTQPVAVAQAMPQQAPTSVNVHVTQAQHGHSAGEGLALGVLMAWLFLTPFGWVAMLLALGLLVAIPIFGTALLFSLWPVLAAIAVAVVTAKSDKPYAQKKQTWTWCAVGGIVGQVLWLLMFNGK